MKRPSRVGDYTPERLLFRSYFGALWEGTKEGSDEAVAIRVVDTDALDAEEVDKTAKAARATLGFEAKGVYAIREVVDDDGLGLVSDPVEGDTVRTLLRQLSVRRKLVPFEVIVRMALDLCDAVDAAHSCAGALEEAAGFGYGGITPDAFVVGSDGTTRLVEPGIETVLSRSKAFAHHAKRLGYDAPELLEGDATSPASDVFTIGAVTWELVAGKRLMPGATLEVVARRWKEGPLPRADAGKRLGKEDVPSDLADVLAQALAVSPDERFDSPAALREAFEGLELEPAGPDEMAEIVKGVAPRRAAGGRGGPRRAATLVGVGSALPRTPMPTKVQAKPSKDEEEAADDEPEAAESKPEAAESKPEAADEPKAPESQAGAADDEPAAADSKPAAADSKPAAAGPPSSKAPISKSPSSAKIPSPKKGPAAVPRRKPSGGKLPVPRGARLPPKLGGAKPPAAPRRKPASPPSKLQDEPSGIVDELSMSEIDEVTSGDEEMVTELGTKVMNKDEMLDKLQAAESSEESSDQQGDEGEAEDVGIDVDMGTSEPAPASSRPEGVDLDFGPPSGSEEAEASSEDDEPDDEEGAASKEDEPADEQAAASQEGADEEDEGADQEEPSDEPAAAAKGEEAQDEDAKEEDDDEAAAPIAAPLGAATADDAPPSDDKPAAAAGPSPLAAAGGLIEPGAADADLAPPSDSRRNLVIAAVAGLAALIFLFVAFGGDDEETTGAPATTASAEAPTPPPEPEPEVTPEPVPPPEPVVEEEEEDAGAEEEEEEEEQEEEADAGAEQEEEEAETPAPQPPPVTAAPRPRPVPYPRPRPRPRPKPTPKPFVPDDI